MTGNEQPNISTTFIGKSTFEDEVCKQMPKSADPEPNKIQISVDKINNSYVGLILVGRSEAIIFLKRSGLPSKVA